MLINIREIEGKNETEFAREKKRLWKSPFLDRGTEKARGSAMYTSLLRRGKKGLLASVPFPSSKEG